MIQLKRAYEQVEKSDGYRVLVDRLWPRGVTKDHLLLDGWLKELAPSSELRKKFAHEESHWGFFQTQYEKELKSADAQAQLQFLSELAKDEKVTLVYGSRDVEHNNAVVLKRLIEEMQRSL